ncbi:MAG: lactate utilization protein C [Desulfobacterales bacterium]|nr:lactate utilization protein C [Desulfobacterales bacterium]
MDADDQKRFLAAVRTALGVRPDRRRSRGDLPGGSDPRDAMERVEKIKGRGPGDGRRLLALLTENAAPIHLNVTPVKNLAFAADAIARLARDKRPEWGREKKVALWRHPLIDALNLPEVLAPLGVSAAENLSGAGARDEIIASYIGVTSADYCLADSATLVMKTRPGQARSVSLVPSIHVAVIRVERILADLKELYALLNHDPAERAEGLTRCLTFISGPSKTADIEGVMIQGAHGPRELHLYVITGAP